MDNLETSDSSSDSPTFKINNMKFRLVELDDNGEILKIYYCSPMLSNEEDFDKLKKEILKKYSSKLDFKNISSKRKFEIHKTIDNVLWRCHSNPILV